MTRDPNARVPLPAPLQSVRVWACGRVSCLSRVDILESIPRYVHHPLLLPAMAVGMTWNYRWLAELPLGKGPFSFGLAAESKSLPLDDSDAYSFTSSIGLHLVRRI